jgi:ABC-type glutathione transport system ATPase component
MAALLSVEGLTVEYDVGELHAEAVSDVSFELGEAERVGLVGESGAGKSVVARAIMGLIRKPGRITGGRILFDGTELTTARESVLDRIRGARIALIPQDASFAGICAPRAATRKSAHARR